LGRVLVTGGAGRIARDLRARLGRPLRLLDLAPVAPSERDDVVRGDLCALETVVVACAGVDAIVHLGGIATEAPFADLLRVNVDGTRTVLEAAHRAGVPRVVLASSIHAAGFYRRPGSRPTPAGVAGPDGPDGLPAGSPPRPDSYYGWSKAAMESLGSLYADRFGLTVLALRIGAWSDPPADPRHRDTWVSPDDGARLVAACLDAPVSGFRVLWAVSANPRRWLSIVEGRSLGHVPRDSSAGHPDQRHVTPSDTDGLLGTRFCVHPLGRPL
jgi:uronate dehydrogenase